MRPSSQLPAPGSQSAVARVATAIGAASLLIAADAIGQNVPYSTHDWTLSVAGPEPSIFDEAWADVKMPGGFPVTAAAFPPGIPATADSRLTYAVGTIEVNLTIAGLFSGQPVTTGGGAAGFPSLGLNVTRQVALLQFNNGVNANVIQRYFYGTSVTDPLRATNARAVAVWRTGDPATDRIAICGETYDETLPLSQAPIGWALANALSSSGFIAVFNGNGDLQWTHHFFDPANPGTESCAITDISIRVDGGGNEIVTYCGISTHGAPAGGELAPLNEYPAVGACNGGATPLPAGQWDGIVGRVVFAGAGPSARVLHANVGGPGQDGLFGLAEIDENRFAVVGSAQALAGQGGFPFSSQCAMVGPYVVGAVLVFDSTGGVLAAPDSEPLGTNGPGINTVARDVHIGRNGWGAGVSDLIYVVGSTDDTSFQFGQSVVPQPPVPALGTRNGPTDGFVAVLVNSSPMLPWTFAYHGGPGNDGLTGVGGWNEFSEHVTVAGFADIPGNGVDIDVASYFFNSAIGVNTPGNTGTPNGTLQLLQIRDAQFGGFAEDRPAVMGAISATTAWQQFGLGQESGGGVAVGPDGRSNVVGRTGPGGGYLPVTARGPDLGFDAVRTVFDLVPAGVLGVGRTDGTGFQAGVPGFPPAPASGFTGGTTPFCALAEFGIQIGQPAPGLQRMLIDFEGGLAGSSTDAAIVVSRPTAQVGAIVAGVLEIGFPPAAPWLYLTGTEFWLGGGVNVVFPVVGSDVPFRLQLLAPLPPGGGLISVQMVCLLAVPVTGPAAGCASIVSASPALWFGW